MSTSSKVRKIRIWPTPTGWRWHAVARNGRTLFSSGESFTHKGRTIVLVANEWPHAVIEVLDDQKGAVVEVAGPLN